MSFISASPNSICSFSPYSCSVNSTLSSLEMNASFLGSSLGDNHINGSVDFIAPERLAEKVEKQGNNIAFVLGKMLGRLFDQARNYFSFSSSPKEKNILAMDIGSGGTKVIASRVATDGATKTYFSKYYPVKYKADLQDTNSLEFSEKIQKSGMDSLLEAKNKLAEMIGKSEEIFACGVATAAFREAKNGQSVAKSFQDQLNAKIEILSQDEEGQIAYRAALSMMPEDKSKDILVWDVGGGSMQFTYKNNQGKFIILGSELASQTTYQMLVDEFPSDKDVEVFGSDFTQEKIRVAIDLIKSRMPEQGEDYIAVSNALKGGAQVAAVGSFHNLSVLRLVNSVLGRPDTSKGYTSKDLMDTIHRLKGVTYEDLKKYVPTMPKTFAPNTLSNLLLIYASMEKMGISEVSTVEVNNANALISTACDWRETNTNTHENDNSILSNIGTMFPVVLGYIYDYKKNGLTKKDTQSPFMTPIKDLRMAEQARLSDEKAATTKAKVVVQAPVVVREETTAQRMKGIFG